MVMGFGLMMFNATFNNMAVRRKKNQEYTEKISCFGGYLGGGGDIGITTIFQ